MHRMLEEGASFIGRLTTTGRVTGRPHTVALRLVYHQGMIYASRRDARSDWCRNLIKDSSVSLEIEGRAFPGSARVVQDMELCRTVSELKYRGRCSVERRTVVEIELAKEQRGEDG